MIDVAPDSNTVAKTYTWGLDLSGDLQGAGGVGGLLCVTENPASSSQNPYYVSYDANGNISEYVDDSDSVVAHYEYSPFGKITSSSGSKSSDFNHRFSTKYLDTDTALYYYGYRYYSSELGRWLSRDPIGEQGGVNLYVFVGNDSISKTDLLGLDLNVYSTGEAFGQEGIHHVYVEQTDEKGNVEDRRGRAGSSGTAKGQNDDSNTDGSYTGAPNKETPTDDHIHVGEIDLPEGVSEDTYMEILKDTAEKGLYVPWINDCHTSVERAAESLDGSFEPNENYEGRVDDRDSSEEHSDDC